MTPQEAIRTLKMKMLGDSEQMKYAKQIAIEALERQIPKEPIKKYDCKNCIHDEICPVWDDYNDEPCQDGYRGFCHNYDKFKDKSTMIKLPCKVGDKICRIIFDKIYYDWEIEHIEIYQDEIGFYDDSNNYFTMNDIGKTVFLTKEKAEARLKELNENEYKR